MVGKKEKYLAAAQKFIERGQLDKALAEYTKVVQEDPKDTRTWLKMAELHAKRGANAEATEIYLRTGDLYSEQGFAQKAVAVYKNVLKLSPGTVAAHLKLGALFRQLGLVSDAVQQFEQAALALQRAEKFPDAVAALRQATDLQPDSVVLRVKLAEGASQARLVEEAVREFAKAADQLKAQGRADESLRVVERLLFHQPQNFTKARELAEAYIAKGSPRLALPKLQACLNGDPRDPRTLSLLARALEQLGQVPKAVSVLKELVRLCEDLGRGAERDAAVLRGLTLDPNDRELRAAATRNRLRGVVAAAAEVTPPPVAAPQVATQPQPMFPEPSADGGSFDLSGPVRLSSGSMSGRVISPASSGGDSGVRNRGATVSLDARPDVNRILAEADVFVKYGLLERAADHLARVFDSDPDSRDARERLISVLQKLGRKQDAARHLGVLARQLSRTDLVEAKKLAEKALQLDPDAAEARAVAGFERPTTPQPEQAPAISLSADADPAAALLTPPAVLHGSNALPTAAPAPALALAGPSDLDDGPQTSDILIDVGVDMSMDAGIDLDLDVPSQLGSKDWGDGADEVTPAPREPNGSAIPSRRGGFEQTQQEVDDRAPAFVDDSATVAGGMEHLMALSLANEADEEELSGELEQVTFFADQGMPEDARALLQDLEARFPGNRRVAATLRELEDAEARLGATTMDVPVVPPAAATPPPVALPAETSRPALARTLIEGPFGDGTPAPRAVVDGGEAPDFSTHADLAVAYKEMGLVDAAIHELKLLVQDPAHEVFALTTMGECYEAKGTFTEAVIRYKRALNCEQVTREETMALYYLLGGAFDRLGDISEALYFYEKVAKREPSFRDAVRKVAELKPRMAKRAP